MGALMGRWAMGMGAGTLHKWAVNLKIPSQRHGIYHTQTPQKILMLVYVISEIKGLKINDDQMIPTANPPKPFPIVFLEN